MLSLTEENYLKTIYHLSDGGERAVQTNAIAESMNTKPASVTDMIKKLSAKKLITYEKYYGSNVTRKGMTHALMVIRKHRLWETFLVNTLNFSWDEVHEVADQLEHIQSPVLIEKLDEFLGHPVTDPHGHPIPDKNGRLKEQSQIPLAECPLSKKSQVRSVKDDSATMLQYLSKVGIHIGSKIAILQKMEFDGSIEIMVDGKIKAFISKEVSENILVTA